MSASNSQQTSEKRFAHLYTIKVDCRKQCPIVYADEYNISFFGVERLHPFDSKKWGRVHRFLIESGILGKTASIKPKEVGRKDLLFVHTKSYLNSLNSRYRLATILEVILVLFFPTCLVNRRVLRPMRFQTGGSILAARLALQYGWAINIGGGFHHASRHTGGGFCVYADVTLLIRVLLEDDLIRRAMIVDLDAHQGNGHERDFMNDKRVFTMDFYNADIYPNDTEAKRGISRPIRLESGTGDDIYIPLLARELKAVFCRFPSPDLLVYIAGTDSLIDDPLGCLCLSPHGIIKRDHLVFSAARQHHTPIVMLTSGGYTHRSAKVIADSILQLHNDGLINLIN